MSDVGYQCRPCRKGNFERLEWVATSDLLKTLGIMNSMVQCSSRDNTILKIKGIIDRRKRQSGIHIVMSGGKERHLYTKKSEVKEIYIEGERIYPVKSLLNFYHAVYG